MSAEVVRSLFAAMQARDWAAARALVHDDALVEWPVSGERFRGERWIAMNEAYPEGWTIHVVDVVAEGDRVAARVAVDQDDERFWCAGWYRVRGGVVTGGTEVWATEGAESPPDWRLPFGDAR